MAVTPNVPFVRIKSMEHHLKWWLNRCIRNRVWVNGDHVNFRWVATSQMVARCWPTSAVESCLMQRENGYCGCPDGVWMSFFLQGHLSFNSYRQPKLTSTCNNTCRYRFWNEHNRQRHRSLGVLVLATCWYGLTLGNSQHWMLNYQKRPVHLR